MKVFRRVLWRESQFIWFDLLASVSTPLVALHVVVLRDIEDVDLQLFALHLVVYMLYLTEDVFCRWMVFLLLGTIVPLFTFPLVILEHFIPYFCRRRFPV
jgi:hypothetical protein